MKILIILIFLKTIVSETENLEEMKKLTAHKIDHDLILVHTGAINGRLGGVNHYNGHCSKFLEDSKKCFGGLHRLKTYLDDLRASAMDINRKRRENEELFVIFVFSGGIFSKDSYDFHSESAVWSNIFKTLKPDLFVPTYKEVMYGNSFFQAFYDNLGMARSVILTNMNPQSLFPKHKIMKVNGRNVLLLGVVCDTTSKEDFSTNMNLTDPIAAIDSEITKVTMSGVKISATIVAAYCQCGLSEVIAIECPLVTIVVEGNCEKLFTSTKYPPSDLNDPIQPQMDGRATRYPLEISKLVGNVMRKAYIVNSYQYGKYVGKLYIKFKEEGLRETIHTYGNSRLLDYTVPKNKQIQDMIEEAKTNYNNQDKMIGTTGVKIDPRDCVSGECTFGKVVTNAMIFGRALELNGENFTKFPFYSDAHIAFVTTDLFRNRKLNNKDGDINDEAAERALNKNFSFVVVEVSGFKIIKALNKLAKLDEVKKGGYLQMYGIRANIDRRGLKTKARVLKSVEEGEHFRLTFQTLFEDDFYMILIDETLYKGTSSEKFDFTEETVYEPKICSLSPKDLLKNYLQYNRILYPIIDDSITFFSSSKIMVSLNIWLMMTLAINI